MSHRVLPRASALLALILTGCPSIAPTNPFDPATPAAQQATARLTGQIIPEAVISMSDVAVVAATVGELVRPDASGRFSVGLAPGSYDLSVEAPAHETYGIGTVRLDIGETRDVGALRLVAFRGSISGHVTLRDQNNHAGTVVSLSPSQLISLSDASGAYGFSSVPVGTYSIVCFHDRFATTVLSDVAVTREQATTADAELLPVEGDFAINDGAPYVNVRAVTLDLYGFDHPYIQAAEDPGFSAATWQAFVSPTHPFQLSAGDGKKAVYVRFSDDGTNAVEPVLSAATILDMTPPSGTFTIDDGSGFSINVAGQATVAISVFDAVSGPRDMQVATDGTVDTEPRQQIQPLMTVELANSSVDGDKTITMVFWDAAGNPSAPLMHHVMLDRQAPQVTVAGAITVVSSSSDPTGYATTPVVTLQFGITGATEVAVGSESSLGGAQYMPYPALDEMSWVLTPQDGLQTVYVRFKDEAGNTTDIYHDEITLDTAGPVWTAPLATARTDVLNASVALTYAVIDNIDSPADLQIGIKQVDAGSALVLSPNAVCPSLAYQSYNSGHLTHTLSSPTNGQYYTLYACARDRAGNYSMPIQAAWPTVRYDTTRPTPVNLNSPLPLPDGVELSWTDPNPDTSFVSVSYCQVDAFTGAPSEEPLCTSTVVTVTTPAVACAQGRSTPATSIRIAGLETYRNYKFFDVRPQDCAGNNGDPAYSVLVAIPAIGTMQFPGVPGDHFELFADGEDLWGHYPVPAEAGQLRSPGERLLHCNAARQDCRSPGNWTSTDVPFDSVPIRPAHPDHAAAMFADEYTLFLADVVYPTVGGANILRVVWCSRENDCTESSQWSFFDVVSVPMATELIKAPAGGATERMVALFYAREESPPSAGKMTVTRCLRNRPSRCRSAADWQTAKFDVAFDDTYRPTALSGQGDLSVGVRSAAGRPAVARFGSFCDPCDPVSGQCAADQVYDCTLWWNCGPLESVYEFDSVTTDALPPVIASVSGTVVVAWRAKDVDIGGNPVDVMRASRCRAGEPCLGVGYFDPPVDIYSQPFTTERPQVAINAVGKGVGTGVKIFVSFADTSGHLLATANTDLDSFGSAWRKVVLSRELNADAAMTSAAVGQNLFLSSVASSGGALLYAPVVAVPFNFYAGPKVGAFELQWTANEDTDGTNLSVTPASTATASVFKASDPLADLLDVPGTDAYTVRAGFASSHGNGGWTMARRVEPFVAGVGLQPSGSPFDQTNIGLGIDVAEGDNRLFAVASGVYTHQSVPYGGVAFAGRCSTTTNCAAGSNWAWTPLFSGYQALPAMPYLPYLSHVGISTDFQRHWANGSKTSAAPRVVVGGRWWTNDYVITACDLGVSDCITSGWTSYMQPTGFRVDDGPVSLRLNGDTVMVAGTVISGSHRLLRVAYCESTPATRNSDYYACSGNPSPALWCFDGAHPERWHTVDLDGYVAGQYTPNAEVTAVSQQRYGWLAAQGNAEGGLSLWMCQGSDNVDGVCTAAAHDCSTPARWTRLRVAGLGITGQASSHLDMVTATPAHFPPANHTPDTSLAAVSYYEDGWRLAACIGDVADWRTPEVWKCVQDDSTAPVSHGAKGWFSVALTQPVYAPLASTLRVSNGSLVAALSESGRMALAVCPQGTDCFRSDSWHITSVVSGFESSHSTAQGLLASAPAGALYVAYPGDFSGSGAGQTINLLAGGSTNGP